MRTACWRNTAVKSKIENRHSVIQTQCNVTLGRSGGETEECIPGMDFSQSDSPSLCLSAALFPQDTVSTPLCGGDVTNVEVTVTFKYFHVSSYCRRALKYVFLIQRPNWGSIELWLTHLKYS